MLVHLILSTYLVNADRQREMCILDPVETLLWSLYLTKFRTSIWICLAGSTKNRPQRFTLGWWAWGLAPKLTLLPLEVHWKVSKSLALMAKASQGSSTHGLGLSGHTCGVMCTLGEEQAKDMVRGGKSRECT